MKTIDELRLESNGQTRLLYHIDYWDGPLSGIMLWNGERVYFLKSGEEESKVWDEEEQDWDYSRDFFEYKVYRIPEERIAEFDAMHAKFEELVSENTIYDENGKRVNRPLRSSETHREFYKNHSPGKSCVLSESHHYGEYLKEKGELLGEFKR